VPFIPRGDRPVFCSAVKRLLTQGYELDAIGRQWGQRPCQNDSVREVLRSGTPGPFATTDGTPPSTADGSKARPSDAEVAAAAAALIGELPGQTSDAIDTQQETSRDEVAVISDTANGESK
jgi:hypothetical protein